MKTVSAIAYLLLQNIRAELRSSADRMEVRNPHVRELIEAGALIEAAPRVRVTKAEQDYTVYTVSLPGPTVAECHAMTDREAAQHDAAADREEQAAGLLQQVSVDVLAVMDAAAGHARVIKTFAQDTGAFRVNNAQAAALAAACTAALAAIEARAAVAELIEADAAMFARVSASILAKLDAGEALPGDGLFVSWREVRAIRAALVRVQGLAP